MNHECPQVYSVVVLHRQPPANNLWRHMDPSRPNKCIRMQMSVSPNVGTDMLGVHTWNVKGSAICSWNVYNRSPSVQPQPDKLQLQCHESLQVSSVIGKRSFPYTPLDSSAAGV
jgi:hypothetical protein